MKAFEKQSESKVWVKITKQKAVKDLLGLLGEEKQKPNSSEEDVDK